MIGGPYMLTDLPTQKEQVANIVLKGPKQIFVEKSLHFAFKTSNKQEEYEAILAIRYNPGDW